MRERPRMRAGVAKKKISPAMWPTLWARAPGRFVRFLDFVFFAERRVATATVHCLRATRQTVTRLAWAGSGTCNATTRDETSGTRSNIAVLNVSTPQ